MTEQTTTTTDPTGDDPTTEGAAVEQAATGQRKPAQATEPTPLEAAEQTARDAADRVTSWQAEADDARAKLDQLETGAGAAAVDRPEKAADLADQIATTRARLTIAEAAIPEAQRRHAAAVAAACRAEADTLTADRMAAQDALAAHEARTVELLGQLREHTGTEWRRVTLAQLVDEDRDRGGDGRVRVGVSTDAKVREALAAVERRQQVLRGVAEGLPVHEALPDATWDDLGRVLRPGGVADVGWTDPADAARQEREAEWAELAAAEEEHAQAEAALATLTEPPAEHLTEMQKRVRSDELGNQLPAARARLVKARARLFTARAVQGLDPNTGEPEGDPCT